MYIHKHNEEANLLRRRLELLEHLNTQVENNLHYEEMICDTALTKLQQNFKSVAEPIDVVKALKKIYGDELKWKK